MKNIAGRNMKNINLYVLPLLLLTLNVYTAQSARTLLISLDGFRWDYLSKVDTPNFDKFVSQGVQVRQVTNAFATLTLPNHWTLVTGLYEEQHGIIANKFYDKKFGVYFNYSDGSMWFNNTDPLWITAVKEGKKSGAYMWVGNQAKYGVYKPTKQVPFVKAESFKTAIKTVISWLTNDDLDFVCLYNNEPDVVGHKFGPDSKELKSKIKYLDKGIGNLMTLFDDHHLTTNVNILIASDHGMTNIATSDYLDLSTYVNFETDALWFEGGTIGLCEPKPDKMDKVYMKLMKAQKELGHMNVYRKEDLPDAFHYKSHPRIPSIVIVVENGWKLQMSQVKQNHRLGDHGFDNKVEDMKSTFLARGPDFKCGDKQETMKSVDIYPLICKLLDLKTCHQSQGTLENTRNLLSSTNCLAENSSTKQSAAPSIMICNIIFGALLMFR